MVRCPRCGYEWVPRRGRRTNKFCCPRCGHTFYIQSDNLTPSPPPSATILTEPTTISTGSKRSEEKLSDLLRRIVGELKELRREVDAVKREVDRVGSDLRVLAFLVGVEPRLLRSVEVVAVLDGDDLIRRCVEEVGGRVLASSQAGLDLDIPDDRWSDFEKCLSSR